MFKFKIEHTYVTFG